VRVSLLGKQLESQGLAAASLIDLSARIPIPFEGKGIASIRVSIENRQS